jgi:hypothetical protein
VASVSHEDPTATADISSDSVLLEAHRLVTGARNTTYGGPVYDYTRVADIVSATLSTEWTATDALVQMLAVKLARIGHGISHDLPPEAIRDSLVDLCGYAHCLWEAIKEPT